MLQALVVHNGLQTRSGQKTGTLESAAFAGVLGKLRQQASGQEDDESDPPIQEASVTGARLYYPIDFVEGVKQFHDAKYKLTRVPNELRGTVLFQGPCRHQSGDEIIIAAPEGSTAYVLLS